MPFKQIVNYCKYLKDEIKKLMCYFCRAFLFQKSQKLSFKTDKFATGIVQVFLTVMLPTKQGWETWKERLVHLYIQLSAWEFAVQLILQEFYFTKHLPFLMQGKSICKYCLYSFESLAKEINSNPDSFCHPLRPSLISGCCLAPETSPLPSTACKWTLV